MRKFLVIYLKPGIGQLQKIVEATNWYSVTNEATEQLQITESQILSIDETPRSIRESQAF